MIWNYLFKRLLYGLVSILITTIIVSSIIFLVPVDPARMTFGQQLSQETLDKKTAEYGLDQPLLVQLRRYLKDLSPVSVLSKENIPDAYHYTSLFSIRQTALIIKTPYLRDSYQSGRPVTAILKETWPLTIILSISAILLATFLGICTGALSAKLKDTIFDKCLIALGVMGYSLPSYVSALIFSIVFGYFLHDYTGLSLQGSLIELNAQGEEVFMWSNLILPAIALGIRPVAVIMQMTRSALLEVMQSNYIITGRAKGLSIYHIWVRHGLKNAANPIVSTITSWFAALLAGAFFVETIFNFGGIGSTTVNALLNFDIPVLLGCILSVGVFLVLVNILTDMIYAYLDPRLKLE